MKLNALQSQLYDLIMSPGAPGILAEGVNMLPPRSTTDMYCSDADVLYLNLLSVRMILEKIIAKDEA